MGSPVQRLIGRLIGRCTRTLLRLSALNQYKMNYWSAKLYRNTSYHDYHTKLATITMTALRRSQHTTLTLNVTIAHTIDIFLSMQTKGDATYNTNN